MASTLRMKECAVKVGQTVSPQFRRACTRFWSLGLGLRVWGLEFRVWGLGFRVEGLGFGCWDLCFSVSG